MEEMKQCPQCRETIKSEACVCRYCHSDLQRSAREQNGKFVKMRLKTGERTYVGDLFVPEYLNRVSDVLNDGRHFLILVNAVEETTIRDIPVGFVAINKDFAEWVRLVDDSHNEDTKVKSRTLL